MFLVFGFGLVFSVAVDLVLGLNTLLRLGISDEKDTKNKR